MNNFKESPFQLRIPNLRRNFKDIFSNSSKFLETSPLEQFYVVVKQVLKSAWIVRRVVLKKKYANLIKQDKFHWN